LTAPDIFALHQAVLEAISDGLRTLLQTRHLYQSLDIALEAHPAVVTALRSISSSSLEAVKSYALAPIPEPWLLSTPRDPSMPAKSSGRLLPDRVHILVPDIKAFCSDGCNRLEAFNVVSAAVSGPARDAVFKQHGVPARQVFVLTYECQSCKGTPETFLVSRVDLKLQLCGRAPIEHVEVPAFIPKSVRRYWAGSVVAFQSGQVLAALFLLRTLIEQFARQASGSTATNADQVLEAYMRLLPADFKDRFPSLSAVYEQLSAAVHEAREDGTLYESARVNVWKHFDARRVFGLPNA